jgi:hypothetical protein
VAATGPRENPQIVGQACYFIDPSTNLAETAFIVSPEWQRGVRGFVAEIMSTNDAMIRLAQGGWSSVSTESMGSTVRVTALF